MKTQVIHIKHSTGAENEVYIGRAGKGKSGYFGNPVIIDKRCVVCDSFHNSAGETLPCYTKYLNRKVNKEPDFREAVKALDGKVLVCFCKKKPNDNCPCHGDVLAKKAEELNAGLVAS